MKDVLTPQSVLMASDLSVRSDRALARAAQLSSQWRVPLTVVHALSAAIVNHRQKLGQDLPSWRKPQPWVSVTEKRLRDDLAAEGIEATGQVVVGTPAEVVSATAARVCPSVVVLGQAKEDLLDRVQLGSLTDTLVRQVGVPLLNVRERARKPYQHVLVATDFSDCSALALQHVRTWFPQARLTLFHAYLVPGSRSLGTGPAHDTMRANVQAEMNSFVQEAGLVGSPAAAVNVLIEHGEPTEMLRDYLACSDVDLVALGSHGRSGFARALLGSMAEQLLRAADMDTLVVRKGLHSTT